MLPERNETREFGGCCLQVTTFRNEAVTFAPTDILPSMQKSTTEIAIDFVTI